MDLWDQITNADCEHDHCIEVEPGMVANDPCIGYCRDCGERLQMGFTWSDCILERDFEQWAKTQMSKPVAPVS